MIPDPGEEYAVTDEAVSQTLVYRWYSSREKELLVEIAYRLPEEQTLDGPVEYRAVGGMWGTYAEAERTRLLILRDSDVLILIELFGGEEEELKAYAQHLAEANR